MLGIWHFCHSYLLGVSFTVKYSIWEEFFESVFLDIEAQVPLKVPLIFL